MGGLGLPKTGGRKKGTANKTTISVRQRISQFVEENFDEAVAAWKEIDDPKDKLKAYTDLCTYAVPKLQAVQLDANVSQKSSVIEDLEELSKSL